MKSIRWPFGIFNGLREQQRAVKCSDQFTGRGDAALQMSNNSSDAYNRLSSGIGNIGAHGQSYTDYPVQVGQARCTVEIQNGQWGGLQSNNVGSGLNISGLRAGIIGHDGIPRYFKWDNTASCMVEVVVSTPIWARLARSFEAFLQSWRLG